MASIGDTLKKATVSTTVGLVWQSCLLSGRSSPEPSWNVYWQICAFLDFHNSFGFNICHLWDVEWSAVLHLKRKGWKKSFLLHRVVSNHWPFYTSFPCWLSWWATPFDFFNLLVLILNLLIEPNSTFRSWSSTTCGRGVWFLQWEAICKAGGQITAPDQFTQSQCQAAHKFKYNAKQWSPKLVGWGSFQVQYWIENFL